VAVSFVSVWLNDVAVSWGRDGIRRVIVSSVEEIIYGRLRQHRSYSAPQISINVKNVVGKDLIRPTLSYQPETGDPVTVSAERATMHADAAKGVLTITCRNGTLSVGDVKAVFPDELTREIPLDTVSRKGATSTSPSEIAMADFPRARAEQLRRIESFEETAAAKVAIAILSGRLDMTMPVHTESEQHAVKVETARLHRIIMEPWRRWANGFSCLCFVLVGAPMAIRMRNADFLTSFFLCFLPILLVYYPVFMFGVSQAKSGAVPPLAVWTGNVLVTLWGVWLMRSVIRT
jgi:lipopolysaccharide export system permease protein